MNNNVVQFIPKLFSILRSGYSFAHLRSDLLAGFIVSVVALPLALALGIASGACPENGLITAVVAGFFISFLGGSRVQIGGPTGAFVVVIFNVISQHGFDGLLIATILAGCILVISGYLRLGQLIKYIPYPVITGFTTGIALIIFSTQIKNFLGLQMEYIPAEFLHKWAAYFSAISTTNLFSLAIGASSLAAIYLFRRYTPKMPAYLMVLIISSLIVAFFHLPVETIGSNFPHISCKFNAPHFPAFSYWKVREVLPSAFTIAFLAGIEALLSAMVADSMTGFRHRPNQELIGQGVANIASSLFGGLPATGALARTATNIMAGGKSPLTGIFHSLFLLLFILFTSGLMKFIPMAVLAAILFFVAWGMSETHRFVQIIRLSYVDGLLLILTFLLTVLSDLTVAIGVGITLSALIFMARMSKSVEMSAERVVEDYQRENLPPGVEAFWIAGPVFFGIAGELPDIFKRLGRTPKILIIRMRLVPYLDASGASAIHELVKFCKTKNTKVIFSAVQKQPEKILSKLFKNETVEYAPTYEQAVEMTKKIDLLHS